MHVAGDESDGSKETPPDGEHPVEPVASPPRDAEAAYAHRVAQCVAQATLQRDEVDEWIQANREGGGLEDHITEALAGANITDAAERLQRVNAAARRQQLLLLERKRLKKEQHREERRQAGRQQAGQAAGAEGQSAGRFASEPGTRLGSKHGAHDSRRTGAAAAADTEAARVPEAAGGVAEPSPSWAPVRAFATQEEALRFVVECQPFDYRPLAPQSLEPAPSFEGGSGALAQVLAMQPPPSEFVSAAMEFHRRLRIRKLELEEQPVSSVPSRAPATGEAPTGNRLRDRKFKRGRNAAAAQAAAEAGAHQEAGGSSKEPKPWMVESAGALFERPSSLRALREAVTSRYFVAVAPDVERRVLQEGFRVRKRCSIPCSATPKEAIDAFARGEQRAGRAPGGRPGVLAVSLPPDIDVVRHREGGFLIRCTELPPGCFSRARKACGGEAA